MSKKEKKKETNNEEEIIEEQLLEDEAELEVTEELIEDENQTITVLEQEVLKLKEDLLRERAEVENFKRRVQQENIQNVKYANQKLLEEFLPILDGFDRALVNTANMDEQTSQFLKGFEMLQSLLKQTLENAGLELIPTVGTQFDPYMHQAVAQETDETKEDNEILEELQKGYKLNDRVVRASMVKVNKK